MSKCKSIYHKSTSQEYRTNKWCSCCERDICFTCYPLEKWIWCSNCQMDMCLDCYKCQFNHNGYCFKYTKNLLMDKDDIIYRYSELHILIQHLCNQFIRDLLYQLPCDKELIDKLHYLVKQNKYENPFYENFNSFFDFELFIKHQITSLYNFDYVEVSFIRASNNENTKLYKDLIGRYDIKQKYKDKIVIINIILYNNLNIIEYEDIPGDNMMILQHNDNFSFYDILPKYKNIFTLKDKYIKSINMNKDIKNIIMNYSNIFNDYYTLSFNPLKPKLYMNNIDKIDNKYVNYYELRDNIGHLVQFDDYISDDDNYHEYFIIN